MKDYIVRVQHYREQAGLTQKELAHFLDVTKNTIVNYERFKTHPPMATVVRLAHILNVTTDQLLSYTLL